MSKLILFSLNICFFFFVSSSLIYSFPVKINDNSFFYVIADSTASATDTLQTQQEIGKIFTAADADSLFGPVQSADTVKTQILVQLAEKSPSYLMFNLIDGKANILDSSRTVLFGTLGTVKPDQVFRLFSTSKVLELIKQGGSDTTIIELRTNVLTLTNGTSIMEEGLPCPPYCEK